MQRFLDVVNYPDVFFVVLYFIPVSRVKPVLAIVRPMVLSKLSSRLHRAYEKAKVPWEGFSSMKNVTPPLGQIPLLSSKRLCLKNVAR